MPSIFDDGAQPPDDATLGEALGKTKKLWDELARHLDAAGIASAWKFYGKKHGWQLNAVKDKRAVIYLIPNRDGFTAALALKDSAMDALRSSDLPASLVREIEGAKVYGEGRPARIQVATSKDAAIAKKLIAIKLGSV